MSNPNPDAVAAGHVLYACKKKKHGVKKLAQLLSDAGQARTAKLSARRRRAIARLGGIARAAKLSKQKTEKIGDSVKS